MMFKGKKKLLNHSIYTSVWKPNRPVQSTFVSFCFLDPPTLQSGGKTGLYKTYCSLCRKGAAPGVTVSPDIPICTTGGQTQQGLKS